MDNRVLLEKLAKIPEIRLNKHPKSEKINGECIIRKPNIRRKNVVGEIIPTGSSFILRARPINRFAQSTEHTLYLINVPGKRPSE